MGVYISYKNNDGLDTRITFVGVSTSGYPIDIPVKKVMPLINSMKLSLESAGIKDVRIVYPKR